MPTLLTMWGFSVRSLLFALVASVAWASLPVRAETSIVGRVSLAVGAIHRIAADGQRTPLKLGDTLRERDRIVTGADALAMIVFVDQARLALRPDTEVWIKAYRIDPSGVDTQLDLELLRGTVRQISGRAAQAQPDRFRLNTPIAAIGVRGTDFLVRTAGNDVATYVHEGAIVIQPPVADCPVAARCPIWAFSSAGDAGALLQVQAGGQVRRLYAGSDDVERIFGMKIASGRSSSSSPSTAPASRPAGTEANPGSAVASSSGGSGNTGSAGSGGSGSTGYPAGGSATTGAAPAAASTNAADLQPTAYTGLTSLSRPAAVQATLVSASAMSSTGAGASGGGAGSGNTGSSFGASTGPGTSVGTSSGASAGASSGTSVGTPSGTTTATGGSSTGTIAGGDASSGATTAAPVAITPVKGLAWARAATVAPAANEFALLQPLDVAQQNRQITVGELGAYNLWRTVADPSGFAKLSGRFSFGLAAAEARFTAASGLSSTAAVDAAASRLDINFDAATFSTFLRLGGGTVPTATLSSSGSITSSGLFSARSSDAQQSLAGALTLDGREAGYFFNMATVEGRYQGITLWGLPLGTAGPSAALGTGAGGAAGSVGGALAPTLAPAIDPGLATLALPTQLVWGRFSTSADIPITLALPYEQASAGRQVTVGEAGQYALWRATSASGLVTGLKGEFTFGLSAAQAFYTPTGGAATVATVNQASLGANFDTATFSTRLLLGGGTVPLTWLEASGRITEEGLFTSRSADGTQVVAGAFTVNAKEAGYLFKMAAKGGQFQGITLWGRKP